MTIRNEERKVHFQSKIWNLRFSRLLNYKVIHLQLIITFCGQRSIKYLVLKSIYNLNKKYFKSTRSIAFLIWLLLMCFRMSTGAFNNYWNDHQKWHKRQIKFLFLIIYDLWGQCYAQLHPHALINNFVKLVLKTGNFPYKNVLSV